MFDQDGIFLSADIPTIEVNSYLDIIDGPEMNLDQDTPTYVPRLTLPIPHAILTINLPEWQIIGDIYLDA